MKRSRWLVKFGIVVVMACLCACGIAKAVSGVALQWNLNTDPSVVGYNLYYGGASRNYTNVVSLGITSNAVVNGLSEGKTYFFAVTAYDAYGDESDYSDETVYIIPGFLLITPGTGPGAPVRIQFPVAPDHWYELQTSGDLRSWTTIWQITGIVNNWVEYDATPTSGGPQFFRLILH